MTKRLLIFLVFLICFFSPQAFAFKLSNFENPESVVVDSEDGSYYVSNVKGNPVEKDGQGFISKITSNGNTVIQKYFGDKKTEMLLNAPKGLVIAGKNIFVTDIDTVKGFNKETGKPSVLVDLSQYAPSFLNDIAADAQGFLYVSDTFANRIYKINPSRDYEVTLFKEGPELGAPNGLVMNPKTRNLMVATWDSGQILTIDAAGKTRVLKKGLSKLDGIDYDNEGNIYVSSYGKGEIYKISYWGRGPISVFLGGLKTPADISVDRKKNEMLIPSTDGGTVTTHSIPPP
jgi:sugar lactone lactonase YvrE